DARAAGMQIEKLVDQLSNWYVRRNRRRFWKSEHGDDKQAAYLTLFECIDLCCRMMAPFMPFLSEAVYRNLHRARSDAPESVHLTEWPQFNPARLDAQLVFEMDVVQRAVGLGRSAREESRVRVRQPLSRMLVGAPGANARAALEKHEMQIREELNIKRIEFIGQHAGAGVTGAGLINYIVTPNFAALGKRHGKLMPAIKAAFAKADGAQLKAQLDAHETCRIKINGAEIEFARDDIKVQTTSAPGYACARDEQLLVALDIEIDETLRIEGIARELVRAVQDARKSAGLEVSDRIALAISGSARVEAALRAHREHIMSETLAASLSLSTSPPSPGAHGHFEAKRELDKEHWRITLAKA
ncbi:MAG: DUF5915 domain-containing protein, partial [Gammaproteobacteria bacterium]